MELGKVCFEKYRILEELGHGGTSKVYLAENIKVGNKWAIKMTKKASEDINLLAEPNILKNLNHIYIPKIIDIEEDEHSTYIIEEYVEGINLKAYKATNPIIQVSLILQWAIKLCDVLKYLHSRKPHPIIYRDMKPENIMVMDDGKIKLIDFGIAREYKEDCLNDTVPIGTKGYAAPEQYGIGQSDERTDIFSLGMTIYFLLTSKNLSHPPYQIQWNEQINTEESNQLFQIVLKCCEILPNLRYQTVDALEKELLLLMDHKAIEEASIIRAQAPSKVKLKSEQSTRTTEINVKKTVTIGVLGITRGVGVTHAAIMLAQTLSKKNKVALVELNDNKHFKEIGYLTQDEGFIDKKIFTYNKIHYYWGLPFAQFITGHREQYDFVVLDLGDYEQLRDIDEFVRADIRIVLGHGMDWKLNEIRRFYQRVKDYDPNRNWIYLIPFMDKKAVKDVKDIVNCKVFPLPFNMNPFSPSLEVKRVVEAVING